ncbi:MAG: hypothetical protein DRI46_14235 [Chloroflexi bacterium]|nr:MAG: hypothetical protein DRI46_14235 [Chloroflexota bacterium]
MQEYPDPIREAILYAILNQESISDHIIAANMSGFQKDVDAFWQFAELGEDTNGSEGYMYGLPEGIQNYRIPKYSELEEIISDIVDEPVTVVSAKLALPGLKFFIYDYLQKKTNWTFLTNLLDYGEHFDNSPELETWEYTGYIVNPDTNLIEIKIEAVDYEDRNPPPPIIMYMAVPPTRLWYQAIYVLDSTTSDDYVYVTYDPSTGVIPELDLDPDIELKSEFFPVVVLRVDHLDIDRHRADESYDAFNIYHSTVELLAKLAIDLDEMMDAIREAPEDDLDDLAYAFFMFGLNIYTEEKNSIAYLANFFNDLRLRGGVTKEAYEASMGTYDSPKHPQGNLFQVQETGMITDEEVWFDTVLSYNYITTETKQGTKGPVGAYDKKIYVIPNTQINRTADPNDPDSMEIDVFVYVNSYIRFRYQETATTYIELIVHGLTQSFIIQNLHRVGNELTDSSEEIKNSAFFIPVSRTILKRFSGTEESLILYDAMQIVVYAIHEEKLEWYETSAFMTAVTVVAMMVGGYYFGANYSLALANAGIAATSAASGAIAMKYVGSLIVSALLVDYAVEWILETIGGDLGIIVAATFAIVAAAMAPGSGFNTGTFAENLMKVVTIITKVVRTSINLEMDGMKDDYQDWLEMYETRMDAFDEANEILSDRYDLMNPLMLITEDTFFDPNQSPDEYYNTKTDTNPGVKALDFPRLYVMDALRLPEMGYDGTIEQSTEET